MGYSLPLFLLSFNSISQITQFILLFSWIKVEFELNYKKSLVLSKCNQIHLKDVFVVSIEDWRDPVRHQTTETNTLNCTKGKQSNVVSHEIIHMTDHRMVFTTIQQLIVIKVLYLESQVFIIPKTIKIIMNIELTMVILVGQNY